jgi:glycosyltransferase involved in cell wall biosynthesis
MTTALFDLPPAAGIVYHCVDDVAAQPGMPSDDIRRYEEELVRVADIVFVSSRALEERWTRVRPVIYEPNSVNATHFARPTTSSADPLAGIPRPRLGFVGAVAAYKVDAKLLLSVFRSEPNWSLVIIGPRSGHDHAFDELFELPNVHDIGLIPYADLPSYMRALDVGLIPAQLNAYTESMFPLKFLEYLAAGLPVVATRLPALAEYGEVVSLCDADRFADAIRQVLSGDAPAAEARRRVVEAHTYEARTKRMLQALSERGLPRPPLSRSR